MIKLDFTKFRPEKGKLLLSEPFSRDLNFKRTVVLLAEHNEEGSIGFILNRFLGLNLGQVAEEFAGCTLPVFDGGPIQRDSLFFVHTLGDIIPDRIPIIEGQGTGDRGRGEGLFWSGNSETVRALLKGNKVKENEIRLFLGYSGWSSKQLEDEIKHSAWLVAPASREIVFSKVRPNDNSLWHEVIKNMGKEYSIVANFPENPLWN